MSKPTGNVVPLSQPPEQQPEKLPCPRCESTNTKFCYYNNYNLSQPRYFCKSCRRYWTRGGTLRNVPVGGGTRKNSKRPRASSTPSSSSSSAVYAAVAPPPQPPCDVDLNLSEGSFTSLLTCDPTGNNNVGFNGGYGVGTGFGFGFGFGQDVGSTWQMGNGGDGMDGGDCFGWSDLAISTAGNGLQ
ncbi:uncharacterized protein LOC141587993 [Silene latifolia]|uniref:uncharacterized protein LOC141587993 n=1 Tax=Silene latifolia TaxID=37657 RepID=UPI003D77C217